MYQNTVKSTCFCKLRDYNSRLNLLVLGDTVDAFTIYNQLQEVFLESQQVVAGMRVFLDALYSDTGLQGMADAAYGVFGNPLFVVDKSYKYLAISSGTVPNNLLMEQENTFRVHCR